MSRISYSCERFGCYAVFETRKGGRDIFIQTDWDRPGLAASFGWTPRKFKGCSHDGTDGTVDCPDCGRTASAFIEEATDWLDSHEGKTVNDPGYF